MPNPSNLSESPGSRGRRLAAEFVAGLIGSVACAVLGLLVGAVIGGNLYGPGQTMEMTSEGVATDNSMASDSAMAFAGMYGYEATGWVGLIVGVIVGGSAGVYWAGRLGSRTSSYLATFLTSVLAVLVGAGMLLLTGGGANGDWLFNKHPRTLPILFLMTLLGGMLGFEVTRRQKEEPTTTGSDPSPGR